MPVADGMAKEFWFPFEPAKWLSDADLRRCSKRARATWIDMLCLMHDCEVRGVLRTGDHAWSLEEIASAVPGDSSDNLGDIRELLDKGVASREDGTGAIMCRMMHRRFMIAKARSEAGKMGAEAKRKQTHQQTPQQMSNCNYDSSSVPPGDGMQGKGERGGSARPPPPPAMHDLVPLELLDLFQSWSGRPIGPAQFSMLHDRIERHGLPLVAKAVEMHVKTGTALGNWNYLDKIIEGGAKDRNGGMSLDKVRAAIAEARRRGTKT